MAKKIEVVSINKGVPIPDTYERYPFDQLEVGDSFEITSKKRASVQSRVSVLHRQGKRQYIVRKIDEDTYGVWRVEDRKE